MFCIEEELKKLPHSPGVYIMHDKADTIIYVGKSDRSEQTCALLFPDEYEKNGKDPENGQSHRPF